MSKKISPVTENPKEDAFYKRAEASLKKKICPHILRTVNMTAGEFAGKRQPSEWLFALDGELDQLQYVPPWWRFCPACGEPRNKWRFRKGDYCDDGKREALWPGGPATAPWPGNRKKRT